MSKQLNQEENKTKPNQNIINSYFIYVQIKRFDKYKKK